MRQLQGHMTLTDIVRVSPRFGPGLIVQPDLNTMLVVNFCLRIPYGGAKAQHALVGARGAHLLCDLAR